MSCPQSKSAPVSTERKNCLCHLLLVHRLRGKQTEGTSTPNTQTRHEQMPSITSGNCSDKGHLHKYLRKEQKCSQWSADRSWRSVRDQPVLLVRKRRSRTNE